jgi:hypothetical protein
MDLKIYLLLLLIGSLSALYHAGKAEDSGSSPSA